MNTKKDIVKFLNDLAIGLQQKRDKLQEKVNLYADKLITGAKTGGEAQNNMNLLNSFQFSLEYTKGQLYEVNYILENITRDNRKKE